MSRIIRFDKAINEATDQYMARDPSVYVMGLGVPDAGGVFGTTLNLEEKHGADRVLDMPASENGMTGVAIGSALVGMRPIITHQRIDFAVLSLEQLVNQASNWHYMFGGKASVPLVIRMIIGRGWGQGPQHSQSLQSWFAHVPGLKVVMPTTPYDAKGLLASSIEDENPVIFIEHRWLHGITGEVPSHFYTTPIGKARVAREGTDLTIVSTSYMTLEAMEAAKMLASDGVNVEVIDVRTLKPLDEDTIFESVSKTGNLIAADSGWRTLGFAAEILARVTEKRFSKLKKAPVRVTLPDSVTPTTPGLAAHYYPRAAQIIVAARRMLGMSIPDGIENLDESTHYDVPNSKFTGPF